MKLIVDISESDYDFINVIDGVNSGVTERLYGAVFNGTPLPDSATNGEVLKVIFPDMEANGGTYYGHVYTDIPYKRYVGVTMNAMRAWWNAPYRGGEADADRD